MKKLDTTAENFDSQLDQLLAYEEDVLDGIEDTVRDIVRDVRRRGDEALIDYTNRFDRRHVDTAEQLVIDKAALEAAREKLASEQPDLHAALEEAASRVHEYHLHQKQQSWSYRDGDGTLLGQKITPLDRAGLYVPGGKAAYPSAVIMEAMPAKVAGVGELVLVSPAPDDLISDVVLAAAAIAGIDQVITIGGAQAIAALAYGTQTVKKVDKIVGPGNIYVATAKRQVFGRVDIDMFAGPSEILVVGDGDTPADWIALDLFSQAEHDEMAQAIFITWNKSYLKEVEASVEKLLPTLERRAMTEVSLRDRGGLILCQDEAEAVALINRIAPEHLELSMREPHGLLNDIRHAGAIFLGKYTSEALGDYCAGPNHVLPTSGTARFSSPLGVYDFIKRSSLIEVSEKGARKLGKIAGILADSEHLEAHARSARARLD